MDEMHMTRKKLFRLWPLLFLILFILFPLEWLGLVWPALGVALHSLFPTDVQHAIGHIGLFLLLGLLALYFFPHLYRYPYYYVALILIGVGQEGFQLLFKQRMVALDDWVGVGRDFVGLVLAYLIV